MKAIKIILILIYILLLTVGISYCQFFVDDKQVNFNYQIIVNDSLIIEFGKEENILIVNEKEGYLILNNSNSLIYYIQNKYKISYKDILIIKKDIKNPSYLLSLQYDEDYDGFVIDDYENYKYLVLDRKRSLAVFNGTRVWVCNFKNN